MVTLRSASPRASRSMARKAKTAESGGVFQAEISVRGRIDKGELGFQVKLLDVKDNRSLRYRRGGSPGAVGVLRDPIPGFLNTLIGTGLVIANGHRKSAVRGADQAVTDQTFDGTQSFLYISLVF